MGEAFLHNHGSAELHKLFVRTPPSKTIYYYNDPIDMAGSVVVAVVGHTELILAPGMYSYSPLIATAGTTQITVLFTFGRKTLTATVPITVGTFDPVFGRNTWQAIAAAAAAGVGQNYWNAGDEKTEIINYIQRTFRILDFNCMKLYSEDERYNDNTYNGGSNKANITLQSVEKWGTEQMGAWQTMTSEANIIHVGILAKAYGYLPPDLKEAIRLVEIKRATPGYTYAYRLHLLAVSQMFPVTPENAYLYDVDDAEASYYSQCAFYANKGALIVGDNWPSDYQGEWLISNQRGSSNERMSHNAFVDTDNHVRNAAIDGVNNRRDYYPVFSI